MFTPCSHPPNLVVIHEPVLEISCGQTECAQTHRHTDRHMPMTTRPCGLQRAGNNREKLKMLTQIDVKTVSLQLTAKSCVLQSTVLRDSSREFHVVGPETVNTRSPRALFLFVVVSGGSRA